MAKPFLVRRSFTPLPDYCFVPIDYRQQEFKLMADYAGELELIEAMNSGMDAHEATAQMLGVSRKFAKTLNFGLLYGMGGEKLARALKIPLEDALYLRAQYFNRFPKIKAFIKNVMNVGSSRRYIWNWYGFRNHISSAEYAYVLPNHLIQGSGAQVIRVAMVKIHDYMRRHKLRSEMICQVHDELLFHIHKKELGHIEEYKKIMEAVYKARHGVKLDCDVTHSWKSWAKADQISGSPS